jgi:Trypsin-like peptidase domain
MMAAAQNNETEGAAWLSNMPSGRFHVEIGPQEDSLISGARYAFHQKMVKIDAVAGFRGLQLPQLDGLVVALDWVANDRHHVWGSAVMVAPGVALTAGHVIDEMRCRGFLAEAGGQLWAISVHAAGRVELWRADSFTQDEEGSDLSLLTLLRTTAASPPPADCPLKFSLARMAAGMPCIGETISLIGFKAAEVSFERGAIVGLVLVGSVGQVTDQYPQRRDSHGLPNPAIAVDARTVGGMSGGAAFDGAGHLIGVISSGLSSGLDESPSFVSLSWPAIHVPIAPKWPMPSETCLAALAKDGWCGIEHLDDVRTWMKDGLQITSIPGTSVGEDSDPS